jgi:phage protein D
MTDKVLAATVTNTTSPLNITVSQSHDSSVAVANINCISTTLDVGDPVTINLGYSTGTTKVFEGYVKQKDTKSPDGTVTITAHDVLVRAVDFFIVSTDPEHGFVYRNITAHALIQTVLEMAGLNDFDFDNTYFTFGINNDVEVNLVSSFDYSRMISDLIAWMVWADRSGTVKLKNRKPYPMDGSSGQPGDVADSSIATITDASIYDATYGFHERDLRNKVVIYGAEGLYAEAKSSTSYDPVTGTSRQILPSGFYKAIVLSSSLIDNASFAQDACNYNLDLYNRLSYSINMTVEGLGVYEARKCVLLNSTKLGISSQLWYVLQAEHSWSSQGFTTNLTLTR